VQPDADRRLGEEALLSPASGDPRGSREVDRFGRRRFSHLELGERTWLSVVAATPVTRPRLIDAEAPARFNWGF
jgi:hypothetical protein